MIQIEQGISAGTKQSDRGLDLLIAMLGDECDMVAEQAMRAAARLGADVVPALSDAMRSSNPKIRENAARALVMLVLPAVPALHALAEATKDSSPEVRELADWANEAIRQGKNCPERDKRAPSR